MKKLLLPCILLWIATTLFSCKGDQGATGPAGANGNANVSASTVTITPGEWAADGNGGWYVNLTANGYDPTKSALSIYWSANDADFTALPFVGYTIGSPDINYVLNSTTIEVLYDAQTGVASINQPNENVYLNIVVIPSLQVAKMKLYGVNMNDYNEVQAYIKLNSK